MIFVDDFALRKNGQIWYHLMSDTIDNEIHKFAESIGLRREWFHNDHYDVVANKRKQAVAAGAIEITAQEMVKIRKAKRYNSETEE